MREAQAGGGELQCLLAMLRAAEGEKCKCGAKPGGPCMVKGKCATRTELGACNEQPSGRVTNAKQGPQKKEGLFSRSACV